MTSSLPDPESLSRTTKILIDSGAASFEAAENTIKGWTIQLVLGPETSLLPAQIAALTAAVTAKRAAGTVLAVVDNAEIPCQVPGFTHLSIHAALEAVGATVVGPAELGAIYPSIVIGGGEAAGSAIQLQVSWDGWVAAVNTDGTRLPDRGGMPLAPAAAAALAVSEAFGYLRGTPDHGYRNRHLSLWRPKASTLGEALADTGPDLRYLPEGVWFVGLGHLGQAYAWCWRLLPYPRPAACPIYLQDAQEVSEANESTGVLVRIDDVGKLKTRLVDGALAQVGFSTRLVERNLLAGQTLAPDEPRLAIVGVDGIQPRSLISSVGWGFAVDVGLGSGPSNFTSIAVKTFAPADDSTQVSAWRQPSRDPGELAISAQAYQAALTSHADHCGIAMLAGRAAAAAFVGVLAACLAITEPLRYLHGGETSFSLAYDLARSTAPRQAQRTDVLRFGSIRT